MGKSKDNQSLSKEAGLNDSFGFEKPSKNSKDGDKVQ